MAAAPARKRRIVNTKIVLAATPRTTGSVFPCRSSDLATKPNMDLHSRTQCSPCCPVVHIVEASCHESVARHKYKVRRRSSFGPRQRAHGPGGLCWKRHIPGPQCFYRSWETGGLRWDAVDSWHMRYEISKRHLGVMQKRKSRKKKPWVPWCFSAQPSRFLRATMPPKSWLGRFAQRSSSVATAPPPTPPPPAHSRLAGIVPSRRY